jgi:predicted ATPase
MGLVTPLGGVGRWVATSWPRGGKYSVSPTTGQYSRDGDNKTRRQPGLTGADHQLTLTMGGTLIPIGRDAEAGEISRFLRELPSGSRILLVEGEAGIGKTTSLREGLNAAVQLGMTVLSAYPVEAEMPLEFAGLADLLDTVPTSLIGGLPVPQRQAVRQAVLRVEPPQRAADPRTVATAVLTLLRKLAGEHMVVVVIDDLPWLDTPSSRALSFALRRLRLEPVGLLAAVRTGWSERPRLVTDSIPAERVGHLSLPFNLRVLALP